MNNKLCMLVTAAVVAVPAIVFAQSPQTPPCGPRDSIIKELGRTFEEVPMGRGLAGDGTVLEVLVSPQGTWTILVSTADGKSCFATAGEGWQQVAPGLPTGGHAVDPGVKFHQISLKQ
jgi:hypothetical protein